MESVPSVARLDENICLEDAFANIFFVVLRIDQIAILTYYCFFGRICYLPKHVVSSLFFIFRFFGPILGLCHVFRGNHQSTNQVDRVYPNEKIKQ